MDDVTLHEATHDFNTFSHSFQSFTAAPHRLITFLLGDRAAVSGGLGHELLLLFAAKKEASVWIHGEAAAVNAGDAKTVRKHAKRVAQRPSLAQLLWFHSAAGSFHPA